MGQPDPRWTEAPEFNWIPDQPFHAEFPDTANSNEPSPVMTVRRKVSRPIPRPPRPTPRRVASGFTPRQLLKREAEKWAAGAQHGATLLRKTIQTLEQGRDWMNRSFAQAWISLRAGAIAVAIKLCDLVWRSARATAAAARSAIAQAPVLANSAQFHPLTPLTVGALQGAGLMLLAAEHSMLASALTMVLLLAPLLLLAGFGRVPGKLLLPWTAFAAVALAALGAYQYWRGGGIDGSAIAIAAVALFIGQALMTAWAKDGEPLAAYPAFHYAAWTLAVQSAVCVLCAACAALGADALGNLLRQHYPGAHLVLPVVPLVTLAVAFASWLLSRSLLRRLVQGLLTFLILALPVVTLFAASVAVSGPLLHWQPPLLLDIALAAALLLGINASYGAGEERPRWRQSLETLASLTLSPLVVLGGLALHARVTQLGWTAPRIFAAACLGVFAAYAASYLISALVSLGGGRWMQRIERANLAIGLAVLVLIAALASPLADPVRLSVQSQTNRIQSAAVDPEAFDFHYLRQDGERFGHEALMAMAALPAAPDVSRGAFVALATEPNSDRPTPTQIGANIAVRGGQGRLPASLLTRDWSKAAGPGVPPCLTAAALRCEAYFTDLDGDGSDEIVLVYGTDANWWAGVMKQGRDGWYSAGTLASSCRGSLDALRAGRFAPVTPLSDWRDLLVGGTRLTVALTSAAKNAGCPR